MNEEAVPSPEEGDRVVAKRPDGEIEIWKVFEAIGDQQVILEHTEKTEMRETSEEDSDKEEFPVEAKIDYHDFIELLQRDSVSLLKDPLEQLYFYENEEVEE